MQTNRRCYCNRLYSGFRCAYCRVADFIADDVRPDPREESRRRREAAEREMAERLQAAQSRSARPAPSWWDRVRNYGKTLRQGRSKP